MSKNQNLTKCARAKNVLKYEAVNGIIDQETLKNVADRFGVHMNTVKNWAKAIGIKIDRSGVQELKQELVRVYNVYGINDDRKRSRRSQASSDVGTGTAQQPSGRRRAA